MRRLGNEVLSHSAERPSIPLMRLSVSVARMQGSARGKPFSEQGLWASAARLSDSGPRLCASPVRLLVPLPRKRPTRVRIRVPPSGKPVAPAWKPIPPVGKLVSLLGKLVSENRNPRPARDIARFGSCGRIAGIGAVLTCCGAGALYGYVGSAKGKRMV